MNKVKTYLFNFTWVISCGLLVLLIFGSRVQVPPMLQVAGRLHPLLLHFPIVLIIMYWLWLMAAAKNANSSTALQAIGDWLFLFAVASTVTTALLGFLLGRETGYDAQSLQWHLWLGTGSALYLVFWYAWLKNASLLINRLLATIAVGGIAIAAHLGGEITHGKGFVTAPLATPKDSAKQVNPDTALLFADLVQPILQAKCINCHNPAKQKGELDMSTQALLLKGGKNGVLWDTAALGNSLLLHRIHLPESEEEHMPPAGKAQLTSQEKYILWSWIKHGASFTASAATLPATDSLKTIAGSLYGRQEQTSFNFKAASAATIATLTNNYRVLEPIALESPALKADFFGAAFYSSSQLTDLLKVKDQLVYLSLAKMPVTDEDLAVISKFRELRKLNLSFTNITGKNLQLLTSLPHLQQLSLSGTAVSGAAVKMLAGMASLQKVFVWNTGIKKEDLPMLQQKMNAVELAGGYVNDTSVLKLPTPALLNETDVLKEPTPLLLKNYIAQAQIRYTLDGTEPDSIHSPLYTPPVLIREQGPVKARVFKTGWISSDILEAYFFKARFTPDSVWLLTKAEKNYQYIPAKKLTDLIKGDKDNFRDGEWLAFYENNMEAVLQFNKPIVANTVSLSWLYDPGSYIMPPVYAELWGGSELGKLQLLKKITGKQPEKMEAKKMEAISFALEGKNLRYIKIVVKPVNKLPGWHPGKGQRGWFFIDEIFVN
jgi:uncharacterized membrane protein